MRYSGPRSAGPRAVGHLAIAKLRPFTGCAPVEYRMVSVSASQPTSVEIDVIGGLLAWRPSVRIPWPARRADQGAVAQRARDVPVREAAGAWPLHLAVTQRVPSSHPCVGHAGCRPGAPRGIPRPRT